jgi:hypothetical protein
MSRANQWLHGIRVLDLSRYIPGPLATMLLADLGAEVLKIEAPDGDEMQHLGPRDAAGKPIFYSSLNAGKTVRRMNLKNEAERAEFLRLVESADVLLESFRPGVMAKLGIGYDKLRSINPRLVYCALSGYGANGPLAREAGHDANYLALAGVLYRNGAPAPNYFDPPVCDNVGAQLAARGPALCDHAGLVRGGRNRSQARELLQQPGDDAARCTRRVMRVHRSSLFRYRRPRGRNVADSDSNPGALFAQVLCRDPSGKRGSGNRGDRIDRGSGDAPSRSGNHGFGPGGARAVW